MIVQRAIVVQGMDPIIPSLLPLPLEVGKLQKKEHEAMAVAMVEGVTSPIIGVGMSQSPIIGVVEHRAMAVDMVGGVMSLSPIIGVVEHPAMAGGVISPIITGVVQADA